MLFLLLAPSFGAVASQEEGTITRTVYIEPMYQIYIDEVTMPASSNYTLSFKLASLSNVYTITAFGPQNQSLNTTGFWNQTPNVLNVIVNTQGFSSFRLVTILRGTTLWTTNFTTPINYYPIVNGTPHASSTIYLPQGIELLSYSLGNFTNSTIGGKAAFTGSDQLAPNTIAAGNISYNGSFSLVEGQTLYRVIKFTSSSMLVEETFKVSNLINARVYSINLNIPQNASNMRIYDSLGDMTFNDTGQQITLDLRTRLLPGELAEFTMAYSLPLSGYLQSVGGKNIVSGNLLPEWCNVLVKQANLSIIMPAGSTDAQVQGGTIIDKNGTLIASISNISLTPYENQAYSLSFAGSPAFEYTGLVLLIALSAAIAVAYILYRKFRKSKAPESAPPTAPAPAPAPPKKEQPFKKPQPQKYKQKRR